MAGGFRQAQGLQYQELFDLSHGFLFSYFEYYGQNLEYDWSKMAAHAKTQEWWAIMQPMQDPLSRRKEGEWWAEMDEVFHMD